MIEIKKPKAKAIKYPVSRKARNNGTVVIFWSEFVGTVVDVGQSKQYAGKTHNQWASCTDEDIWKPVDVHIRG
jgi:putative hemolysin